MATPPDASPSFPPDTTPYGWEWSPVTALPPPAASVLPLSPSSPLDPHCPSAARVTHAADDAARAALESASAYEVARAAALAARAGGDEPSALDVCASWATNWPSAVLERSAGVGLCAEELERAGFDDFFVHDLCDARAASPLPAAAYHVATLAHGLPYLAHPVRALAAVRAALLPGATALIAFTDRVVTRERATAAWLGWGAAERVAAAAAWLREAGFVDVEAADVSPMRGVTDALFLVRGVAPPA